MPKFFIKTYGCQMNERDSEQVAHSLITRGYERGSAEVEADVVLLNTCSVRDMADQKALGKMGMLGRMAQVVQRYRFFTSSWLSLGFPASFARASKTAR
jgi:tRNA-2-methylthio-N6-dimethylallyladenosine synthase